MASKRRLVVKRSDDEAEEITHRDDRDIMIEGTWKEWFQKVFLKYCYVVGVLFLVCFVPLEILRQLNGDIGSVVAFLAVLLIVPSGILGYLKLWGDGGIWGAE